jgi:hypothetical protein
VKPYVDRRGKEEGDDLEDANQHFPMVMGRAGSALLTFSCRFFPSEFWVIFHEKLFFPAAYTSEGSCCSN